jgi:BlaI family penicillinase repressor
MKEKNISEAELEVMKVIWDENPVTSGEIFDQLKNKKDWASQTVKTLIARLVKKGFLGCDKKKRVHKYYPEISRNNYLKQESSTFLEKVFDGSIDDMVFHCVKAGKIKSEDIDRLKKILEDAKKSAKHQKE